MNDFFSKALAQQLIAQSECDSFMFRRHLRCFALTFFLFHFGTQTSQAQNCVVRDLRDQGTVKSGWISSPDGQTSAWTEAKIRNSPYSLSTTVYAYYSKKNQRQVIEGTERTAGGRLRGHKGEIEAAAHDEYCPVDWSPDSRFLLIEQWTGPEGSDNLVIHGWLFDRNTGSRWRIDTRRLEKEIEAHRLKKRLRAELYYLRPRGWESASNRRLVFAALPSPGDVEDLGVWSVGMDGTRPKILYEHSISYVPNRFGKMMRADSPTASHPQPSR